jgi:alpha-glucosidase
VSERPWWRDAVFYQVYLRSFRDSDGDGVGDLAGVIERLDYLRGGPDALDVDALWLCPFYPSPLADFGYDIADFTAVDEQLGTLDDFRRLLEEAHRRDLKVIIDWVPNHTSDQHPWFVESRSSRSNPKRDWYVWRPPRADGAPPNNWMADFRNVGPAWSLDADSGEWYLHSFTPRQPDLNWDNPDVREAMHDTLRFWLNLGVDGFRMDVVNKIGKDPALADNSNAVVGPGPASRGRRHDEDWESTFERITEIRAVVKAYDDAVTVGEVYVLSLQRLARYVSPGQLDLAHNFVFMNLPWKAAAFRATVDETDALFGQRWPSWCLGNHDHSRVASRYADDGYDEGRARAAAVLQFALRGTPFIYQGEELGLVDLAIPTDALLDVDGRDRFRGPQPWGPPSSEGAAAGFSSGTPWLPLGPDAETRNARGLSARPESILQLYRTLIQLRRDTSSLRRGSYRSVDAGHDLFGFIRTFRRQRVLAIVNFGRGPAVFRCAAADLHGSAEVLAGSRPGAAPGRIDLCHLRVAPDEALLIRLP